MYEYEISKSYGDPYRDVTVKPPEPGNPQGWEAQTGKKASVGVWIFSGLLLNAYVVQGLIQKGIKQN